MTAGLANAALPVAVGGEGTSDLPVAAATIVLPAPPCAVPEEAVTVTPEAATAAAAPAATAAVVSADAAPLPPERRVLFDSAWYPPAPAPAATPWYPPPGLGQWCEADAVRLEGGARCADWGTTAVGVVCPAEAAAGPAVAAVPAVESVLFPKEASGWETAEEKGPANAEGEPCGCNRWMKHSFCSKVSKRRL